MAEKTEAEKAQLMYEERLAELRSQSEHQFQVSMKLMDTRLRDLQQNFEDRRKELLAQNDGMLGAVGRLHDENESLKARITELEGEKAAYILEESHKRRQTERENERERETSAREMADYRQSSRKAIEHLERALAAARAKAKAKAKASRKNRRT